MRRTTIALVPVLLAACPASPGGGIETTGATDATGATAADSVVDTTGTPTTAGTPATEPTSETQEPVTTLGDTTDSGETDTTTGDTTSTTTGDATDTTTGNTTGTTTGTTTGDTTDGPGSTDTTGDPGECMTGATQACYTGPNNTLDVGECAAGEQTCGPDQTWGPCVGEVLPAPETCDAVGDENCDDVDLCAGEGIHAWSLPFGGSSHQFGELVAFDGEGNLVLAARGSETIDFGGGPLTSVGWQDVFLAKFSPAGQHLWSKRFGNKMGPDGSFGMALAVGNAGEIALAFDFKGALDFGGGMLDSKGDHNIALVKFTPDGAHMWSRGYKSSDDVFPRELAFGPDGELALVGLFSSSLDMGGGEMKSAGGVDAFVAKIDGAGAHKWSLRMGDAKDQHARAVGIDDDGNVLIGGGFRGTINPGNGELHSDGRFDIFLAKLDPSGNAVWAKQFGDLGENESLRSLAIDGHGNVAVVGEVVESSNLGGDMFTVVNEASFVAKYDNAGKHLWSKALSNGFTTATAVAVDGLGNVLVTGALGGMASFGGNLLVSEGPADAFVVKFTPSGAHVWSKRFGDNENQWGNGIAGSLAGNVAVCGVFGGSVNFGSGPKTAKGDLDGFVVMFGP